MSRRKTKKKPMSAGAAIGAAMVGFEQAVFRSTPPAEEMVQHARPDAPVPTGDGRMIVIETPLVGDASPSAIRPRARRKGTSEITGD